MNERKKTPGKPKIHPETLNFIQENVLNVTDLTRTKKLSNILETYAVEDTDEVHIIQNSRKKGAMGVLVNAKHYQRLLKIQEIYEKMVDAHMEQITFERQDDEVNISLSDVDVDLSIGIEELFDTADDVELDED